MINVNKLRTYWDMIPTDGAGANYDTLSFLWQCNKRQVRLILAELSAWDNGDDYILIRSSYNNGFYKTNDPAKITAYKKEVYHRAINTMRPLKKIRRVLGIDGQMTFDELLFDQGDTGAEL